MIPIPHQVEMTPLAGSGPTGSVAGLGAHECAVLAHEGAGTTGRPKLKSRQPDAPGSSRSR
jgi:hypothetical protein